MSNPAAAATALRRVKAVGGRSLGPMAKLPYVQVFDQRRLACPKKVPVPKYFQRGQEHCGRLDPEHVCKWLSRALEGPTVTRVYTGSCLPPSPSHAWSLQEFLEDTEASPFVDGAIVVCCCDGDMLREDLVGAAALVTDVKDRKTDSEEPRALHKEAWKRAMARTRSIRALAGGSTRSRGAAPQQMPQESEQSAGPASAAMIMPEGSVRAMLSLRSERPHASASAMASNSSVVPPLPPWRFPNAGGGQPHHSSSTETTQDMSEDDSSEALASARSEEFGMPWIVDNSVLRAATGGLRELRCKNIADRPPCALVPWGDTVHGVDEGDGWLRLPNGHFMPILIDGIRVMTPKSAFSYTDMLGSLDVSSVAPYKSIASKTSTQAEPDDAADAEAGCGARAVQRLPRKCDPVTSSSACESLVDDAAPTLPPSAQPPELLRAVPRSTWGRFAACAAPSWCASARRLRDAADSDDEGVPLAARVWS